MLSSSEIAARSAQVTYGAVFMPYESRGDASPLPCTHATSAQALAIAEPILADTGEALLAGDFVRFSAHFELPLYVDTFEGANLIDTLEKFRASIKEVQAYYVGLGVDKLHRFCVSAEFEDADNILSTHVSYVLVDTHLVQDPITVLSRLRRHGDRWKIWSTQYAVTDSETLNFALAGLPGAQTRALLRAEKKVGRVSNEGQSDRTQSSLASRDPDHNRGSG